ncbi:hypothetical protein [Streptomyces sp. NPDC002908]|uniref:hypothetical protein n=1 Tax=Streptomyces sp. NPDC002908 TaxID=3364670 RepID=UPI00367C0871
MTAEGAQVVPTLDLALEAGGCARDRPVAVTVTDGQLSLRFVADEGKGRTLVNSARVTEHPGLAAG